MRWEDLHSQLSLLPLRGDGVSPAHHQAEYPSWVLMVLPSTAMGCPTIEEGPQDD